MPERVIRLVVIGLVAALVGLGVVAFVALTGTSTPTAALNPADSPANRADSTRPPDAVIVPPADPPDDGSTSNTNRAVDQPTPATDAVLPPRDAVELGLAGLRHLYPAIGPEQTEVLNHACVGAWGHAVMACNAYGATESWRVTPHLVLYLCRLRAAGLYIQAREDGDRAELIKMLSRHTDLALPLIEASLWSADRAELVAALMALRHSRAATPGIIARVQELRESTLDGIAEMATRTLAWLQDGTEPPYNGSIGLGGNIGGGGGPGGSRGFIYRRTVKPDVTPDIDPSSLSLADLPALRDRYRNGDDAARIEVAFVLAHHGWPDAVDLAAAMMRDSNRDVRIYAMRALLAMKTPPARLALIDAFADQVTGIRSEIARSLVADDGTADELLDRLLPIALNDEMSDIRRILLNAVNDGRIPFSRGGVMHALVQRYFREQAPPDELQRVFGLFVAQGTLTDLRYAVGEAVANASTEHMSDLLSLLPDAEARFGSDGAVELMALVLDRPEPGLRRVAVGELGKRFNAHVNELFSSRVLTDDPEVVTAMVLSLHGQGSYDGVYQLLVRAAASSNADIEAAIVSDQLHGGASRIDARILPALRLVYGSTVAETRRRAATLTRRYGDIRAVPELLPILADPDERVVRDSIQPVISLVWQMPIDVGDLVSRNPTAALIINNDAISRIENQSELWSLLLGRLAAGDLEAAAYFVGRFPRIPLPATPDELEAANLAARFSEWLGVPLGEAIPQPEGIRVLQRSDADADGVGATWSVPMQFHDLVLTPVMKSAGMTEGEQLEWKRAHFSTRIR